MRISDWSSDVCSSDLLELFGIAIDGVGQGNRDAGKRWTVGIPNACIGVDDAHRAFPRDEDSAVVDPGLHAVEIDHRGLIHAGKSHLGNRRIRRRFAIADTDEVEIGRASCRERVCKYVKISVVGVAFKKTTSYTQRNTYSCTRYK